MILALLTRLSPLARWAIAIFAALALLGGLILWLGAREKADDVANQQTGAQIQREADQAKTISNVREANNAREDIKQAGPAGDAVRYAGCMRTARTPANCRRFAVPGGSTDKR